MKAVVAAFNQEKALVGAFSVITNLRMELFEALLSTQHSAAQLQYNLPAWTIVILNREFNRFAMEELVSSVSDLVMWGQVAALRARVVWS